MRGRSGASSRDCVAKFKQRVVKDKRGKSHDLDKMSHKDLVDAIQE